MTKVFKITTVTILSVILGISAAHSASTERGTGDSRSEAKEKAMDKANYSCAAFANRTGNGRDRVKVEGWDYDKNGGQHIAVLTYECKS